MFGDGVLKKWVRLWRSLRQLQYPHEFRIAAPAWTDSELASLEEMVRQLKSQPAPSPPAAAAWPRWLADVGTNLWRLRQKMLDPKTNEPREEVRRAYRHLQSMWDTLTEAGVVIQDHTGERVPQGGSYALKVLTYQPTPGVTHEVVLETIKPTIYCNQELVQMGEVIVAVPERTGNTAEAPPARR